MARLHPLLRQAVKKELNRQKKNADRTPATFDGWPTPKFVLRGGNSEAYFSRAEEALCAGPAGSGKSLMWLLRVYWVCRKYPGARVLIVRKTRESLTESILVTWERDILGVAHPLLVKRPILRRVRQSYTFPNGSVVVVGGLDKPDKVLSSEYDLIYTPEATDLSIEDWETLGGRLRAGAVPYQQIIADCNPTTPHFWLYQRCLAGGCKLFSTTHKDNPRYFNQTTGEWTEAGQQYLARLERMTGARRSRFLEGLWVAAEGVVYEFVAKAPPEGHLLPADYPIPREWPRVWGIDWGKTSPTVLVVWAVDPAGRLYHTREIYKTRLRPDVLGRRAKEWIESGEEPRPSAIVCDHDTANEGYQQGFESESGLSLTLADKADRKKGIEATQARFDVADDGRPRIFFREGAREHPADRFLVESGRPTCGIEELAGYVYDPDFLADEPIAENDHFCFVAGTLIETARGRVPIESVQIGDMALTRAGFREVLASGMTDPAACVMAVQFENGATLTGTPNHPVWVESRGWTLLDALRTGDRVGALQTHTVREVEQRLDPVPVYNLSVADQHEYFANGILVSNCDEMRYVVRYVDDNMMPVAPPMKPRPQPDPFSRLNPNTWK